MRQTFKPFTAIIVLLFLGMLPAACLADKNIVVVVASDAAVGPLSKEQVYGLFLGESSVDLAVNMPFDRNDFALKGRFYHHLADMSLNRLRAFWAKKVFTGRGRPPRVIHLRMLDDTSKLDKGFITYLYEEELTDTVKVVYKFKADEQES